MVYLEYINHSTTRTYCRPNGHPQPHIHHTVHRTSVGSITGITNTTIATTHTHERACTHTTAQSTTVPPPPPATSQHRSVPINNKYIRHVQFTFTATHTTTQQAIQPSTYLYLFQRLRAIQPHTLYNKT